MNQSGWDGLVQTEETFLEFVPRGKSFWEIGTPKEPQRKATNDFKKKTPTLSDTDRAEASFVFVTPRSSGSKGWNEPKADEVDQRQKRQGLEKIFELSTASSLPTGCGSSPPSVNGWQRRSVSQRA